MGLPHFTADPLPLLFHLFDCRRWHSDCSAFRRLDEIQTLGLMQPRLLDLPGRGAELDIPYMLRLGHLQRYPHGQTPG